MAQEAAAPEQTPMVMGRGIPRNCVFVESTTLAPNGQRVYDGQSTGALWRRKGRKETIELAGTFHYAHALEQVDENGLELTEVDEAYRQISPEDDLAALRYLSARFKGEHALDALDIFDTGNTAAEMFTVIDQAYLTLDGADDPAAIRALSKGALGMLKKDTPLLTAIMEGTQMVWDGYPVTDDLDITMLVYKLQAELGKHKFLLADAEEDIVGLCWGLEGDGATDAGLGLTATTGGGTEVSMGGSETSLRLSRDISMEAVDMLNTGCWW